MKVIIAEKPSMAKDIAKVLGVTNKKIVVFREIAKKELTDKQLIDLVKNGKTPIIKGFDRRILTNNKKK